MRGSWLAVALLLMALAGCSDPNSGLTAGSSQVTQASDDGNTTASENQTSTSASRSATTSSSSSATATSSSTTTASSTTTSAPAGNETENETAAAPTPDPATGTCTISFAGANQYSGGNNGVATYGTEICTVGPLAPSVGAFTQAVVTLDWSSTVPPVGLQFDAIDAGGSVLGSASGTSSPLQVTLVLDQGGELDLGGAARLTGVFADFEGTITVALT